MTLTQLVEEFDGKIVYHTPTNQPTHFAPEECMERSYDIFNAYFRIIHEDRDIILAFDKNMAQDYKQHLIIRYGIGGINQFPIIGVDNIVSFLINTERIGDLKGLKKDAITIYEGNSTFLAIPLIK